MEIVADQAKTKPKLQQDGSPKTPQVHNSLQFMGHQRRVNTAVPMGRGLGGPMLNSLRRADLKWGGQFALLPATGATDRNTPVTSGGVFHAWSGEQRGQGMPVAPQPQQCVPVNGLLG
uniref:hypothetical protein n=1 Tax=Neorhizobium sp. EC2-8 TaxID=3129230 RepID=UPI0031010FA8